MTEQKLWSTLEHHICSSICAESTVCLPDFPTVLQLPLNGWTEQSETSRPIQAPNEAQRLPGWLSLLLEGARVTAQHGSPKHSYAAMLPAHKPLNHATSSTSKNAPGEMQQITSTSEVPNTRNNA